MEQLSNSRQHRSRQRFCFRPCGWLPHLRNCPRHTEEPAPLNKVVMPDEADNGRSFVCPFYLRNRHTGRNCLQHNFKRICDVRQHLRRVHLQPRHCATCGQIFDNDPNESRLNSHIAARRCRRQRFFIPGITADQDRRIATSTQHSVRRHAAERWFDIWGVIFPSEPAPRSPYSSGEPPFVQRLLDIRETITSGQVRALVPSRFWTNNGQNQPSISDDFINLARLLERGGDSATPLASPMQTSYEMPAPVQAAQGYGNLANPSDWNQPPGTQAGGHGLTYGPADTLYQYYFPPLDQDDWMSGFIAEGSNQSPPNPAWGAHFDQQYPSH